MKRVGLVLLLCAALQLHAAPPPERTTLSRTDAAITVDGDLSDPGWQKATKFETWYETNPGDNIAPQVTKPSGRADAPLGPAPATGPGPRRTWAR